MLKPASHTTALRCNDCVKEGDVNDNERLLADLEYRIRYWRQPGIEDFPPTDLAEDFARELERARSAIASALTATQSDFAKIVRASDGEQVLFWKGATDDGEPRLCSSTVMDGMTADLNFDFKDNEGGWADLDYAFLNSDVERADAVRDFLKAAVTGEAE